MKSRPTIKIKIVRPEEMQSRSEAYTIVAKVLTEIGGCDRYVERRALIEAVQASLDATGKTMKNLDATISSFCALRGVHAVRELADGGVEELVTKRMQSAKEKTPDAAASGAKSERAIQ